MSLPVFPAKNSIPPATFYNIQGLAGWLNNNPTYKQYFTGYMAGCTGVHTNIFSDLYSDTNLIGYQGYSNYNVENVPLAPNVTTLSQIQFMKYTQQIDLFQRVYTYNSNAYVAYVTNGTYPIYYRFQTYQEQMNYKSSIPLINKLYPFQTMANGANSVGSTLGWVVPFPL